jgi:hypothetical protein
MQNSLRSKQHAAMLLERRESFYSPIQPQPFKKRFPFLRSPDRLVQAEFFALSKQQTHCPTGGVK